MLIGFSVTIFCKLQVADRAQAILRAWETSLREEHSHT